MSDWSGTYSSCEAIKMGLDLEMPGPAFMRGVCVERDIVSGKLSPEEVDECVDRLSGRFIPLSFAHPQVLAYVQKSPGVGDPFEAVEKSEDTPQVRALLREAAESGVVLLKNDNQVLPLAPKQGMTIASLAQRQFAAYSGGGSANLNPTNTVAPLQAIQQAAAEFWRLVNMRGRRWCQVASRCEPLHHRTGRSSRRRAGVICDFYDQK